MDITKETTKNGSNIGPSIFYIMDHLRQPAFPLSYLVNIPIYSNKNSQY